MNELMIVLLEKQAWAQCQQHLAGIEGDDPKHNAWTNYLSVLDTLIKELGNLGGEPVVSLQFDSSLYPSGVEL